MSSFIGMMKSWGKWKWEKPCVLWNKLLFPFAWVGGMVSHRHSCKRIFSSWLKIYLILNEWKIFDLSAATSDFFAYNIISMSTYVAMEKVTLTNMWAQKNYRSNKQTTGASPLESFFGKLSCHKMKKKICIANEIAWGKNKIHSKKVPASVSIQILGLHKRQIFEYSGGDQCSLKRYILIMHW